MVLLDAEKEVIKQELVQGLAGEPEIKRIVIFGSFPTSNAPRDLDIAVFQDSDDDYLTLAMKYRACLRGISRKIPIDVLPLRKNLPENHHFLNEIRRGVIVYER